MTGAALQLGPYCVLLAAPHVALWGDDPCKGDSCVIPWPSRARRYGGARAAHASGCRGAGPGDRGCGSAAWRGARVILWPRPYMPRRPEDYDAAIAQVWVLYCVGLLTKAEATGCDGELRRMRESLAKFSEERGRQE
jgi:hypothetical protein